MDKYTFKISRYEIKSVIAKNCFSCIRVCYRKTRSIKWYMRKMTNYTNLGLSPRFLKDSNTVKHSICYSFCQSALTTSVLWTSCSVPSSLIRNISRKGSDLLNRSCDRRYKKTGSPVVYFKHPWGDIMWHFLDNNL